MKYIGKSCSVEVIQASVSAHSGKEIITLILEYPRTIHAQLLTHRVFSKNSSSTRAVPIKKAIKNVRENPANYMWTLNKAGMQGDIIEDKSHLEVIEKLYKTMLETTIQGVELMAKKFEEGGLNVHKQNAGRALEPYQNIRVCLTSTEWENWDWLRIDADAQPEIQELAVLIQKARDDADYMIISENQWHVPFVNRTHNNSAEYGIIYTNQEGNEITLEEAITISMSCAAQTSYRNLDTSEEKAEDIYKKLFSGKKIHASPSEHQATPIADPFVNFPKADTPDQLWKKGITHMDRYQQYWSGNFCGWIQNRQLIPNHDPSKA